MDAVIRTLYAPAGRRIVGGIVRRYRLPDAMVDDLVQQVGYRMLRRAAAEPIANPEAWIARCARTAAIDLLRHRGRHPEVLVGDDDGWDGPAPDDAADDAADGAAGGGATGDVDADTGLLLAVLRRLVAADDPVFGAALAYVTLASDKPQPHPSCSGPKAGANGEQARAWRALWYAGRHELLPADDRPDTPALRQRRSRAATAVRKAAEAATLQAAQAVHRGQGGAR